VWQALFLLKYDDPRRAAAFLVPRASKFDWKQGVIDRDDTIHFFEQDWPKENKEVMVGKQRCIELTARLDGQCGSAELS
jgi:hypothetical protein